MAEMVPPPRKKRNHEVIDLTSDDDDNGDSSHQRATKLSRHSAQPWSAQPSRPSQSSQPSHRQPLSRLSQPNPRAFTAQSSLANQRAQASQSSFSSQTLSSMSQDKEPDVLDLVQEDDDGLAYELYGSLDNKVVGVRFYNGHATADEVVVCKREPRNPYDANAIQVSNVLGVQIGHIPRAVAAKLAPYLDSKEIMIEAVLTEEKGYYDVPIRLTLYGTSDQRGRLALEGRLKNDRLLKAGEMKQTRIEIEARRQAQKIALTSGQTCVGLGSDEPVGQLEPTLEQLAQASQAVQMRNAGDVIKTLAMDEDRLSKMPMASQPSSLRAKLLPYQLQGLAWLIAKENPQFPPVGSDESVQLWKRDNRAWYNNLASRFSQRDPPSLLSGGILADDMGLGKTLQVISLILAGGPGTTLIVAPVSVMSNWSQQIQRHVLKENAPRICIYHGSSKTAVASDLHKHGVVITSYGILTVEASRGGPLMNMRWRRVVLDEGHIIRNAKTRVAEASCKLQAQSRWVLSGTPIVNNIKDLHSLLKFLRITGGIEHSEIFNSLIARPLESGDPRARQLLQAVMQDLCLRRKKDMKFVDLRLPPKTEYIHLVTFRSEEKAKYNALLAEAQGAMKEFHKHKGAFQSVLERLLRLRQICCHWTLCKERVEELLNFLSKQGVVQLNDKNTALLQKAVQLAIDSQEDCPVCIDMLKDPVITHCKHVFCRPCISKVVEVQRKCPMCRAPLSEDKLVEPAPEEAQGENENPNYDGEKQSSKTEALLKIVQATLKTKGSKIVIFSQWTSFLNIIQHRLDDAGYQYARIDGSMKPQQRDSAIDALDNDPKTCILLASLGVCSVGLNLVSADTVILADSWWAPAIEDQAVDRVHRLGQTRPTTIWRLIVEDTVEQQVLEIQKEKRELVMKAFQEKKGQAKNIKETRMADIARLLS